MRQAQATQGGLMARTTPAGERWAEWLNAQLKARGWRQPDLLAALGADAPSRQTVNSWVKGQFAAGADMAFAVGEVFGVPIEAVRVAGCPRIANALDRAGAQTANPSSPGPAEQLDQFAEGIRVIKARGLPPAREKAAIADFTKRANRMVTVVYEDLLDDPPEIRNEPKSA